MATPWERHSYSLPSDIPTMITPEEAAYLHWLGAEHWSGRGDVIEFGPWLGGSTYCLAAGMKENAARTDAARLHVVDNFVWRDFMNRPGGPQLDPGDSFRANFERNLADHAELLEVHAVRLPDEPEGDIEMGEPVRDYDSGLPLFKGDIAENALEIVFVDGAKSWSALVHMLRELAPKLAVGAAIVFQDFKAVHAYWVPMAAAALRESQPDCLGLAHVLPFNSVTFTAGPGLSAAVGALPEGIAAVKPADGLRLLTLAADTLERAGDATGARTVRLGAVPFLAAKGQQAAAWAEYRRRERSWPLRQPPYELDAMRTWLRRTAGPGRGAAAGHGIRLYHRASRWRTRLIARVRGSAVRR